MDKSDAGQLSMPTLNLLRWMGFRGVDLIILMFDGLWPNGWSVSVILCLLLATIKAAVGF